MQLANPFSFPLAMLAGVVVMTAGIRLLQLPQVMVLPMAATVALGTASLRKTQQPPSWGLSDLDLEADLQVAAQRAQQLVKLSTNLRQEGTQTLTQVEQIDLLVALQLSCDRLQSLPTRVVQLAKRLQQQQLLSLTELQQQRQQAQARAENSTGLIREQLTRMVASFDQNIHLVEQGQDSRRAQVANFSTLLLDIAGLLQALQNQIKNTPLTVADLQDMQALTQELRSLQDTVDQWVNPEGV
ncbi:MAG: hypothetical protein HC921_08260 [Synechococcaceae cyanobacterium SM2_3_1]|nr:hypothetical protein [Synechococcaceae cyanobacterium SM2_3_1]